MDIDTSDLDSWTLMREIEALESQIEFIRAALIDGDKDAIRDSLSLWGEW